MSSVSCRVVCLVLVYRVWWRFSPKKKLVDAIVGEECRKRSVCKEMQNFSGGPVVSQTQTCCSVGPAALRVTCRVGGANGR